MIVDHTYIKTPNDHESTLKSWFYLRTTSGGIYSVVPQITGSILSMYVAHPKSPNL